MARAPLFASVKPELLRRPTFASFIALLVGTTTCPPACQAGWPSVRACHDVRCVMVYVQDNYTASTGQAEVVTEQERAENSRFLDAIMATPVMRYTHKYLAAKGLAPQDAAGFKQQLFDIWFQQYGRTRGVKGDSSGFEHVFVGEIKGEGGRGGGGGVTRPCTCDRQHGCMTQHGAVMVADGKVTGVHNWIQIYLEEKAGRLDYRGFIRLALTHSLADQPGPAPQALLMPLG